MIFGPDKDNDIAGDVRFDQFFNHFYGFVVVTCFIMSGILNPLLFWFHHSFPSSIPSVLFRVLNVIDFITTTGLCPYLAYGLLSPELVPHRVPASIGQRIYSAVFAYLLFMSVSTTTVMTATRVYCIKWPLRVMTMRKAVTYPLIALMCLASMIVGINFAINKNWGRYLYSTNRLKIVLFKPGTLQFANWPELAFGGILMSIAVCGCVCAVITGREIYKSVHAVKKNMLGGEGDRKKSNRICVTLVMLSAGIQVAVLLVIVQFIYSIIAKDGFSYHSYYFMYANGLFCSLILSVVNPIITVVRCDGLKTFYRGKVEDRIERRPSSTGTGLQTIQSVNKIGTRHHFRAVAKQSQFITRAASISKNSSSLNET